MRSNHSARRYRFVTDTSSKISIKQGDYRNLERDGGNGGGNAGIVDRACELGGSPGRSRDGVVPQTRAWSRAEFGRAETSSGCHRPSDDVSGGTRHRDRTIGRSLPCVPGLQARTGIIHAASVSWLTRKSFGVTAPSVFSRSFSSVSQSGRCLRRSSLEIVGCERPSRSAACSIVSFSWARHSVRVMPLPYAFNA